MKIALLFSILLPLLSAFNIEAAVNCPASFNKTNKEREQLLEMGFAIKETSSQYIFIKADPASKTEKELRELIGAVKKYITLIDDTDYYCSKFQIGKETYVWKAGALHIGFANFLKKYLPVYEEHLAGFNCATCDLESSQSVLTSEQENFYDDFFM